MQKKSMRPHLSGKKLSLVVHACLPSYVGSIKLEGCGEAIWDKKQNCISKITRAKSVEGMAQVVEHLPSKCKPQYCPPKK
jgi:hypothetical protein